MSDLRKNGPLRASEISAAYVYLLRKLFRFARPKNKNDIDMGYASSFAVAVGGTHSHT